MVHRTRPPARRTTRVRAGLAVAVLAVGACTDGGRGEDQVIGDPDDSTTTAGDVPDSTTETTPAPEGTATGEPVAPTSQPFDGATDPVTNPRPETTQDIVFHTDLDVALEGAEERVTFRFEGGLPGIDVRYAERPIRAAGSGDEVDVAGEAVLSIRFEPAAGARLAGEEVERTYTGTDRVPGAGTVTEVVRTGDFEAIYEWAVGLTAEVPFRVEVDEAAVTVTVVVPAG